MPNIDRDKSHLFPPFASLLTAFEARLATQNLPFYLFEGIRSFERQAELYAQGRTVAGAIVTNARPGYSYHFWGFAADYVLDGTNHLPGIQWSWDIKADLNKDGANDWKQMAEIARECKLESAYFWQTFPEAPHVQYRYGLTVPKCVELYKAGGLPAVWDFAQNWLETQVWPMH